MNCDEHKGWVSPADHARALTEAKADALDSLVLALGALCDNEWLIRRDRAMELHGAKPMRWETRGSSAFERAAHDVRTLLDQHADYENTYANRYSIYDRWMENGRDEPERWEPTAAQPVSEGRR